MVIIYLSFAMHHNPVRGCIMDTVYFYNQLNINPLHGFLVA